MPNLYTFATRDASTIRDGILRVIYNGLVARGVALPNVAPGSDWYLFAQAVGNELAVVEANAALKADAQMADSAEDDDLVRLAAIYGLYLQLASGSAGPGTLTSSATTTIPTGAQLIDSAGLRYQLVTGGSFVNGASLDLVAVDIGKATNHDAGDVLRWVATPAFADERVIVGNGGLTNGHDAEDYEGLRQRLLAHLQTPPRSGNWQHVVEIAEGSSTAVQKGFCYPAIQGGATMHVAVTAAPTAVSKNRDVAAATMAGTVIPYVIGQANERSQVTVTTVANVGSSITLAIAIPPATTASPPGPGGGWIDGTPWPDRGATNYGTTVQSVTNSTTFVVDATAAPTPGVSRVSCVVGPDWIVRTARVLTVSGSTGAWTITIDVAFPGVVVGTPLWPAATNAQTYVNAVLAQYAIMGPGEKTTNTSSLVRGYRHPRPSLAWPSGLGPHMLSAVVRSAVEVTSVEYLLRQDSFGFLYGSSGVLTPPVPASITAAPNIYVPFYMSFYPVL